MSDLTNRYTCGVLNAVFSRRSRRSASTGSLPTFTGPDFPKTRSQKSDSRSRKGSYDASSDCSSSTVPTQKQADRIISRPSQNQKKKATPPLYVQPQQHEARKSAKDQNVKQNGQEHGQSNGGNKVPKVSNGISGELEAMIVETQLLNNAKNMKVYGNLGNLKQTNSNPVKYHPKMDLGALPTGMGNISKKANATSYCRALSTRMDPEQLKIMGNEDYKNGRFAEALSLYDAAISIDPEKASYRSNKSAALTCLQKPKIFRCTLAGAMRQRGEETGTHC